MNLKHVNAVNPRHAISVTVLLSNPAVSTATGRPVGVGWSEPTHPYCGLTEHGYRIEIFSPDGGKSEADATSDPRDPSGYASTDLISAGFVATPALVGRLEATTPVADIDPDAIVVAGGRAPMFTFEKATLRHTKFAADSEAGKMACALCHGSAILRYAKKSDRTPVAKAKTLTDFAGVEEDFADSVVWDMNTLPRRQHVMPWRIEDELRALGANYVQAGLLRGFAIRYDDLPTGLQNSSGFETVAALARARSR